MIRILAASSLAAFLLGGFSYGKLVAAGQLKDERIAHAQEVVDLEGAIEAKQIEIDDQAELNAWQEAENARLANKYNTARRAANRAAAKAREEITHDPAPILKQIMPDSSVSRWNCRFHGMCDSPSSEAGDTQGGDSGENQYPRQLAGAPDGE